MAELLQVAGLTAGYGDAVVLEDIGFVLETGDSMALLGRNGMGKTTLLATLMGATRRCAGLGLGWVPQERDVFASLTVLENLTVSARPGPWDLRRVYALFPRLEERRANLGSQLSGGEQQMLAMARALLLNPRLLLLDEPLEGLAPLIVQELLGVIGRLIEEGSMAVILVEQHARQILPLTRQAMVLERGRQVYLGASAALREDDAMLDRWLGVAGR